MTTGERARKKPTTARAAARALALAAGFASQAALALGLGDLVVRSALGEPMRAEIPLILAPDETVEGTCFRLAPAPSGAEDVPWLSRARLLADTRGRQPVLRLVGSEPVNHPALQVGLRVACGYELTKEYTVLLSPPQSGPALAAAQSPVLPPAAPAPAPADSRWTAAQGESLASIAQSLYPDSPGQQRRFAVAARAANPDLFAALPPERAAALPLRAGTQLTMPDMRRGPDAAPAAPPTRLAAAPPAQTQRTAKAASRTRDRGEAAERDQRPAPRRPPLARTRAGDRLSVGAGASPDVSLTLATDLNLERAGTIDAARRATLLRERELLLSLEDATVAQLAMADKIQRMEAYVGELQQRVADLDRQLQSSRQASAGSAAPLTSANAAGHIEAEASRPTRSALADWGIPAVLGSAALALLLLLRARGRRSPSAIHAPVEAPPAHRELEPLSIAPAREALSLRESAPDGLAAERAAVPFEASLPAPDAPDQRAGQLDVTLSDDHESALELAEIMLSFGRTQGAVQTLADYVESNPKKAVQPWLKLLDVYRDAGMRDEFETLAQQLHVTFNIETQTWDGGRRGASAETLEGYPHVVERLSAAWPEQACLDYLNQLLRDNRDGARTGFPLPVIAEITFLAALLEARRA
jgi:Tfp pilus assembly protein FimV